MKHPLPRRLAQLAMAALLIAFGYFLPDTGLFKMKSQKAFTTKEPLLIEGEDQNSYSLLPAGSVLYHDKSWPEGHQTFHVYFHFKGKLESEPADANVIAPLWLRTVERDEVGKLSNEYPISKEELVKILKTQKMTHEELAQIVRDWRE